MKEKSAQFPTIRLAAAGILSLPLIAWVACFDDCWQAGLASLFSTHAPLTDELGGMITIAWSLLILATLAPVAYRGRKLDRCLTALLAAFPLFLLMLTVLGLLCSAGRVRI